MKNDLISRQAAIDAIENAFDRETILNRFVRKIAISAVRTLPSAQPEAAKRIVGKSKDGMALWYQCDMCNEPVDAQDNFCRGCGRRLTDG